MRTSLSAPLTLASIALAVALSSAPAAAGTLPYVPSGPCASVSGSPAPGATVTVAYANGAFTAGEPVSIQVGGAGPVLLDGVDAGPTGIVTTASTTGSATVDVTLPTPASGTYSVTGMGHLSQATCAVSLTVEDQIALPPATTSVDSVMRPSLSGSFTDARSSLASGGTETPFLVVWAAGGALMLGVLLTAIIGLVRRRAVG
jgi:hypothetical protein